MNEQQAVSNNGNIEAKSNPVNAKAHPLGDPHAMAQVNRILYRAKKLSLTPQELAEMAGFKRETFATWQRKFEARGAMRDSGTGPFAPRKSSITTLQRLLRDLEGQRKAKEEKKAGPQQMTLLTQADINAAKRAVRPKSKRGAVIALHNAGKSVDEIVKLTGKDRRVVQKSLWWWKNRAGAKATPKVKPKARGLANVEQVTLPVKIEVRGRDAKSVLRSLIAERLDKLDLMALALLLAKLEG